MIKYAKVFDTRFKGSVLLNFTFHDHFGTFLSSTGCHATFKKSCQSRAQHYKCNPCHLNSHHVKICSTFDQRNIVLWMLTDDMMNQQVARHFKACECYQVPSEGQY